MARQKNGKGPKGDRAPRGWWLDVRFALGLVLVAASVLGVLFVVSSADQSVRVFAASSALSPGDRIHGSDLVEKSVRLGDARSRYLGETDVPAAGLVVTKAIAAGELVPVSAVGTAAGVTSTSVVISVKGQLAKSIAAGAVVDLWASELTDDRDYGPPAVLVSGATVVRIAEQEGFISSGGGDSVEVLVPRDRLARVLQAVSNDAEVAIVPASIPVRG